MMAPVQPPEDCPGPDECAPGVVLRDRMDRLEAGMRMVSAGHVSLTAQVTELGLRVASQDARLDKLGAELGDNSKATRETLQAALDIKDIVTTGRTMGKLARWAAPTLLAAGVALGVVQDWAGQVASVFAGQRK